MKRLIPATLFMFLLGCAPRYYQPKGIVEDPSDEICRQFRSQKNRLAGKRIAIAEFTDLSGNETPEAKLFTERLTTSLATIEDLDIIERSQLTKLLKEQNFSHSGIVDSETAKKMGKILGVDTIVCGTIARLGRYWEINCRTINVENGKILTGARVKARSEAIRYIPKQEETEGIQQEQSKPQSSQKEVIFVGEGSRIPAGGEIPKQRFLLGEADKHRRMAIRLKNRRKPGLALQEADAERKILRKIIEINPNTQPAQEAKRRLEKMREFFKKRLRIR
ncbi:MAG: hypothetical protein J7L54_03570 [Elusimicrobia bacterium]|nr:hypothetical protein [Elusimicrobiota bacterium]